MIRPFPKITNHPRLRRTKQKIKLHFIDIVALMSTPVVYVISVGAVAF